MVQKDEGSNRTHLSNTLTYMFHQTEWIGNPWKPHLAVQIVQHSEKILELWSAKVLVLATQLPCGSMEAVDQSTALGASLAHAKSIHLGICACGS